MCLDLGLPDRQASGGPGGRYTPNSINLRTGSSRAAFLVPYCAPCTQMNVARFSSSSIIKFDDTVVVGLISDNDEKAYMKEMADLSLWCQDNSLLMSVATTKELIVDFGRAQQQRTYTPLRINGTIVERVSSFKYQGVHITEDLTWTAQTDRKARQCLYHLRQNIP